MKSVNSVETALFSTFLSIPSLVTVSFQCLRNRANRFGDLRAGGEEQPRAAPMAAVGREEERREAGRGLRVGLRLRTSGISLVSQTVSFFTLPASLAFP